MKKLSILIILFLLVSVPIFSLTEVRDVGRTPFTYESITVTTGAVLRLNATHRENAGAVLVTIESNNVRFRIDGGNPTASIGHLLVASAYQSLYLYDQKSIKELRLIAVGGNATVHVTYYNKR